MTSKNLEVVILAAGKGSRMKTQTPKLLNKVKGKSLIEHTINKAQQLKPVKINIVINKKLNFLKEKFKELNFVNQNQAFGTGHAMKTYIKKSTILNNVIIMMGDAPFISIKDIKLVRKKLKSYPIVILGAKLKKNFGNGAIIYKDKKIYEIRESRLLKKKNTYSTYFNTGIFGIQRKYLKLFLILKKNNLLKEYLITDIIHEAYKKKIDIYLVKTRKDNSFGINDLKELNKIKKLLN